MNTIKPISTISYNTEDFLDTKLKYLVDSDNVAFYAYIWHEAEPKGLLDPQEGKRHAHIYLEPNRRVDSMKIQKVFNEIDLNNPLPLGVKPFRFSKFGDWYLYGIHDPIYLMDKGMSRHYTYTKDDIM